MKQLTAEQKSIRDNTWHIVQRSPLSNRIEDETGFVIAVVWHTQADVDAGLTDKTNANAQLMVTSRELLAALQRLIADHLIMEGDGYKQAVDAINKATGKA